MHSEKVVSRVVDLVRECIKRKIPTVFSQFINPPGSSFEHFLDWTSVRESPEIDLNEELVPFADVIIQKNFYTAFTPEFERLTITAGWDTMLICGVSTESCVLKTAVDAFERNLRPIVLSDACASDQGKEMHKKGIEILEIMIGKQQVMPKREVFTALQTETKN